MEAKIVLKTKHNLYIEWSDPSLGFGTLALVWDADLRDYILKAEMVGIDTILAIFKALKTEEKASK